MPKLPVQLKTHHKKWKAAVTIRLAMDKAKDSKAALRAVMAASDTADTNVQIYNSAGKELRVELRTQVPTSSVANILIPAPMLQKTGASAASPVQDESVSEKTCRTCLEIAVRKNYHTSDCINPAHPVARYRKCTADCAGLQLARKCPAAKGGARKCYECGHGIIHPVSTLPGDQDCTLSRACITCLRIGVNLGLHTGCTRAADRRCGRRQCKDSCQGLQLALSCPRARSSRNECYKCNTIKQ